MTDAICSVLECGAKTHAKGYCPRHYQRLKKTGQVGSAEPIQVRGTCELPDCALPHHARGMCRPHYLQARSQVGRSPKPTQSDYVQQRISIDLRTGCWIWTLRPNHNGYGLARWNGQRSMAHRFSYEVYVGPIPPGLVIDHLCRNTRCVNPEHLEPVTQRTNILRGESRAAVVVRSGACSAGHEMTDENTYIGTNGCRQCRACAKRRRRKRYERERLELSLTTASAS